MICQEDMKFLVSDNMSCHDIPNIAVTYFISAAPESMAIDELSLFIGFIAAFVSGYFACKWMVRLVTQGRLVYFAIYCGLVGLIAILSQLL